MIELMQSYLHHARLHLDIYSDGVIFINLKFHHVHTNRHKARIDRSCDDVQPSYAGLLGMLNDYDVSSQQNVIASKS